MQFAVLEWPSDCHCRAVAVHRSGQAPIARAGHRCSMYRRGACRARRPGRSFAGHDRAACVLPAFARVAAAVRLARAVRPGARARIEFVASRDSTARARACAVSPRDVHARCARRAQRRLVDSRQWHPDVRIFAAGALGKCVPPLLRRPCWLPTRGCDQHESAGQASRATGSQPAPRRALTQASAAAYTDRARQTENPSRTAPARGRPRRREQRLQRIADVRLVVAGYDIHDHLDRLVGGEAFPNARTTRSGASRCSCSAMHR